MNTVLVYRSDLLAWSETFIKAQILSLRSWRGLLVGMRELHELPLDGLTFCTLRPEKPSLANRVQWKVNRLLGLVSRSTIERLNRESPSLLHAHFGIEAVTAWPLARALGLPMVVTLHGYDINISREWWEAGHAGPAMRHYPLQLLKLATHPRIHFIAVSEAIRRRAIVFGFPENKITVEYIGVDTSKYAPMGAPLLERERRILFVGRLVEKKGCEYLIRAFAKVRKVVPRASLVIIGDGPRGDRLRELAQELEVSVQFRGALSSSEVRHELAFARVLCLPSVTAANGDAEGFGMVLLEAQASGVPVVTSALGGAQEGIREGVTGYAVPERDVELLTARLITVLTNDAVAARLASAGPRFVADNFDLVRCTQKLETAYDNMCASACSASHYAH
jgi:glycosyltransferase involved in cell wall biosynthesis